MKLKKVSKKLDNRLDSATLRGRLTAVQLVVIAAVFSMAALSVPLVAADQFQDQINQLRQENTQKQEAQTVLQGEAATFEAFIANLRAQIATLEGQIRDNEVKNVELQKQIVAAEEELAKQKDLLGQNIKAMYLEGQITTIEMLASSKDLSEFVDKQQYRDAVKDKIKTSVDKITELRHQLNAQKEELENLIKDQEAKQAQIDAQRAEQDRLLGLNRQQQSEYESQIASNNDKINDLRQQQIIANARYTIGQRTGSPDNGFYPYESWPFSMRLGPGCVDGDGPDRWGYCTRQCVSYTAWAVERSGRRAPMYYGDAKNWVRAGSRFVVGSPAAGDVAIDTNGTWGHAMYVEQVGEKNGRPAIYISQYNVGLDGRYSEEWRYTTGLTFLRFQ